MNTQRSRSAVVTEQPELLPELYKEIFAHSNEPISIISPQGYYIEQNDAHRDLLGYSDEELQGATPEIHLGKEVFETIARELAENGMYRGEVSSRRKNGEVRQIELSAFATRSDSGEPICFVYQARHYRSQTRGGIPAAK